ncbi:hypothetical protein JOF29_002835 [Kribbella aluminosa]|uniref:Uncharacterized protein n=1 Tax=Kribbella aluminosa TaxID=416017 RepID=A0ABS4UJB6_9ACTN|nr:hypothetical protein [Kribbella aluminosa]MBP2351752.1 hypothetical protein [Kribbella aluminosa]
MPSSTTVPAAIIDSGPIAARFITTAPIPGPAALYAVISIDKRVVADPAAVQHGCCPIVTPVPGRGGKPGSVCNVQLS